MVNILDIYPEEQDRVMFLKGLIRLAKADGVIEPEEILCFDGAAQALQVSAEIVEALRKNLLDDIFASEYLEMSFTTTAQALFFIREAMQLCYADGEYAEEEQLEILNIANELGISLNKIDAIEAWIKEGIAWREAGDQLLKVEA